MIPQWGKNTVRASPAAAGAQRGKHRRQILIFYTKASKMEPESTSEEI